MNIYQVLYESTHRSTTALTASQVTQVLAMVDKLWANRRKEGGLEHFAFVVQGNAKLKAELAAVTKKTALDDKIMALAQKHGGYTFTAQKVRAVIKNAKSVDEARAAFDQLAKGSIEEFLTAVKTSADLQQKFQASLTSDTKAWAQALTQIGKEAGYSFKADAIEAVATDVLPNSNP